MKKTVRKLFFVSVIIALLVVCFVFSASAEYYGGFEYTVLENNTVEISAYTGNETTLVIPEEIDGKSVTSIGFAAFYDCPKIESIILPESVNSIGNAAFQACRNLVSITIPEGITSIGSFTFSGCSKLKSITIPKGVTSIGANAFSSCSELESINIPDGITSIDDFAFFHCRALEEIKIPDSVKSIGNYAFAYCESLENITFPDSITYISRGIIQHCTSLESVTIPDNVTEIVKDALRIKISESGENVYPYITYYIYPIVYCNKNSYTATYAEANGIDYVCIDGTDEESILSGEWWDFKWKLDKRTGVLELFGTGFMPDEGPWGTCEKYITSIKIPDGVTRIGGATFFGLYRLKNIIIPESVNIIDYYAFYNCKGLTSINIPDSVTEIDEVAFCGCSKLKEVTIGRAIRTINNGAFSNCESLENVTIGAELQEIKEDVFNNCPNLKNVTIFSKDCKIDFYSGLNNAQKIYAYKGSTAETFANEYGITFVDITTVHAHSFKTVKTVEPTCTQEGKTIEQCICGEEKHTSVEKTPHNYNTVIQKATFTQSGKVETKCTACDELYSLHIIHPIKTVKLSSTEVTYNGKTRSPSITVKDSQGNTLINGTDYDVTIPGGRKTPDQYTYTIKFKGDYEGEQKLTFTILPKAPDVKDISATQSTSAINLKWSASAGATGYRVYQYSSSKKAYVQIASVKTTSYKKSTNLKAGTEYKFKVKPYTKLSDGTVLFGTASEAFATATECKAPKITSVTSPSKSKATVKWSNVDGETGFQLYYSTKKDSGFKKVDSYSANKLSASKTFSASSSGKTIYFKVRAYKKVSGQTIFSEWSAVKSVKLK